MSQTYQERWPVGSVWRVCEPDKPHSSRTVLRVFQYVIFYSSSEFAGEFKSDIGQWERWVKQASREGEGK